ncbi:hypothetical protein T07_835, partial [Trichinella nelsoni]
MDHNNENSCILIDGYLKLKFYAIIDGKLEYFIHCIVMEARTCSTMILLFNINCHYERCKLHIDNVVHMTSPSIFTFNIKKCYKYVLWKLNDYILKICQISKKGIYYSSIQGHILYSHTSPSPVKLNRGMQKLFETCCKFQGSLELQMNRNSLGLNLKVDWNTLLCLKTS